MNSFFDPEYRSKAYVPVVYAYYDRADMMETTPHMLNDIHPLCEIMYVNEGNMSIQTEDGLIRVGQKQFVWIDANVQHWNMRFDDGLCSMMNIEYQYEATHKCAPSLKDLVKCNDALRQMMQKPCRTMVLTDLDRTIYRLMKEIVLLANSTLAEAEKLCSLLCTQVVLETARLYAKGRASCEPISNRYVLHALEIMHRDYPEPLTAASIAKRLHIQPTYLHRLFKEHTVYTMNEHLQRIRIQRAKELLTTTNMNLLEIAFAIGISSQQYFTRLFKQLEGCSPLEYRQLVRDSTSL